MRVRECVFEVRARHRGRTGLLFLKGGKLRRSDLERGEGELEGMGRSRIGNPNEENWDFQKSMDR